MVYASTNGLNIASRMYSIEVKVQGLAGVRFLN